jgi:hypothetical protein
MVKTFNVLWQTMTKSNANMKKYRKNSIVIDKNRAIYPYSLNSLQDLNNIEVYP